MRIMTKKEWMEYLENTWDAAQKEAWAEHSERNLTCVCGAVWEGETMVHAPRKREWAGLTDEDLRQIILAAVGVAEAKLKERNG